MRFGVGVGSADTTGSHDLAKIQFLSGRPTSAVNAELRSGDNAVVSEPFANKHHVRVGEVIPLPLGAAQIPFRVVDIFYDYGSEKGFIVIDRSIMLRYVNDPAPSNLAIYVAPGSSVDTVRAEVEKVAAGHHLMIFTNRSLRAEAIQIFDRTFAITYALEVVAVIVAIIGIAGALLALVIDRRRELGLLRFLGAGVSANPQTHSAEAGLFRPAGQPGRTGAGHRAVAAADLRHQQAVVWLDHPVPLAGCRAAGRTQPGLRGDGAGRILSRASGHPAEPDRGGA